MIACMSECFCAKYAALVQGQPMRLQQFSRSAEASEGVDEDGQGGEATSQQPAGKKPKGGRGRGRGKAAGRGGKKDSQNPRGRGRGRGKGKGKGKGTGRGKRSPPTTPVKKPTQQEAEEEEPCSGPKPSLPANKKRKQPERNVPADPASDIPPKPKDAKAKEPSPKKPSPKKPCPKGGKKGSKTSPKPKAKAKASPKSKSKGTKKEAGEGKSKNKLEAGKAKEKSFARRWKPNKAPASLHWCAMRDVFNTDLRSHLTCPSKVEDKL